MVRRKPNTAASPIDTGDITVMEWRVGRNFIRVGDTVKVRPSRPGKRDGYIGHVQSIVVDENGELRWFTVTGDPRGFTMHYKSDRIERKAQTRSAQ